MYPLLIPRETGWACSNHIKNNMDEHEHHSDLIEAVEKQFAIVLEDSKQGVYIYFDDDHKVCNEKFAKMLGYDSIDEWQKIVDPFPEVFVAEESQDTLVTAYQNAMEHCVASENKISWKKKDGSTIGTKVILAPIAFEDHLLAIHFVSE